LGSLLVFSRRVAHHRLPVYAGQVLGKKRRFASSREFMTSHDPWQFLVAGQGPRRWLALGAHEALGLRQRAVRHRLRARLEPGQGARQAQEVLRQWQSWHDAGLAVAGYLGYDLGAALEGTLPPSHADTWADADLCAFDPRDLEPLTLPEIAAQSTLPLPDDLLRQRAWFEGAVTAALAAIRAGEIYQVNLSVAAHLPFAGMPPLVDALAAILAVQPVPYAMIWQAEVGLLLSGSMEQFLRVQGDAVTSRPIKGTAPRQPEMAADRAAADELANTVKERAENTMIVDMVRNDLQRASHWGSVDVLALCEPTPYATLWHLESEVRGVLRHPADREGLLRATLPPASVTGCPKIQSTQVIRRLEQRWRGPYCGALGLDVPDVGLDLAVGIRQVWLEQGQATLQVGAGIVAQSEPQREWQELCVKAQGALRWLANLRGA
jgi:isochorismate synthase EntC